MAKLENHVLDDAIEHWAYVAPALAPPADEAEYHAMIERLDALLDRIGDDESHPLAAMAAILGDNIAAYESDHLEASGARGVDALAFMMAERGLKQSDFPELGSQGVVSEILNGKRALNLRQVKALAARFGLSPLTFVDDE